MSITQFSAIPSRQDPPNFAQDSDSFLGALPQFVEELNETAEYVNNAATINSGYAATASTSTSQTNSNLQSISSTNINLEKIYLGAKTNDPFVDNTGGALVAGMLYWNTSANEMRVWRGSQWSAVQSITTATTAVSNIAQSDTLAAQATTHRNATLSARDEISALYRGTGTSSTIPGDGGQVVGSLYWNTELNRFFVWTGSTWFDFIYDSNVKASGDIMTGPLTVNALVSDYVTVGTGIGLNASAADRVVTAGSVQSAKTLSGGIVQLGNIQAQTIGPDNINFSNSTTLVGNVTADAFLTCTPPPPSGCYCTLVLIRPANTGYDTRTVTFSTGFRLPGLQSTVQLGWNGDNSTTVLLHFISDGSNLLQISRSSSY